MDDQNENMVEASEPRTPGQMTTSELRELALKKQEKWGPYGLTESDLEGIPRIVHPIFFKLCMQVEAAMFQNEKLADHLDRHQAATRKLAMGMDELAQKLDKPKIFVP